jgi:1-acyl-sn-glycerol-3-phosphate acyltransferase
VILYRLLQPWLPAVIRAAYRMEIGGRSRVPTGGPLVVAANHLSALDGFVLGAAIPRPLHFMAKAELWRHRPLGRLMDGFGAFPVTRGVGDREALARGVELLERGGAVAIFPGGVVRSDGSWLRGAAKMALATGAPILPVRIRDSDLAVAGRHVGFPRIRVTIGEPIPVEPARATIAAARDLTQRVRDAVDALAPPSAR